MPKIDLNNYDEDDDGFEKIERIKHRPKHNPTDEEFTPKKKTPRRQRKEDAIDDIDKG